METNPTGREIQPLDSVSSVLEWKEPSGDSPHLAHQPRSPYYLPGHLWAKTDKSWEALVSIPLEKDRRSRPKTLVCHDMMGGYLQDRFIDGCDQDGYHFRHWSNIDIFVYFSHHFLTIPPPGWVSAARTHGVAVLGTIITEWDEGCQLEHKAQTSISTFRQREAGGDLEGPCQVRSVRDRLRQAGQTLQLPRLVGQHREQGGAQPGGQPPGPPPQADGGCEGGGSGGNGPVVRLRHTRGEDIILSPSSGLTVERCSTL